MCVCQCENMNWNHVLLHSCITKKNYIWNFNRKFHQIFVLNTLTCVEYLKVFTDVILHITNFMVLTEIVTGSYSEYRGNSEYMRRII
jgi:hypothetical protein